MMGHRDTYVHICIYIRQQLRTLELRSTRPEGFPDLISVEVNG
jgi:hypothetical protein